MFYARIGLDYPLNEYRAMWKMAGEPIVQSMEYIFPHQGYERVDDQFLLGSDILVAPLLEKGEGTRTVLIPPGKWKNSKDEVIKGPAAIEMNVPMDGLPVFHREE